MVCHEKPVNLYFLINEIVFKELSMPLLKVIWSYMIKGVPQGPLLINIFLNDIYFVLRHNISIYNYADDNTIGSFHEDTFELKGI